MQAGQNIAKLSMQFPKATKSLVAVAVISVLGVTSMKLTSAPKVVESSMNFDIPGFSTKTTTQTPSKPPTLSTTASPTTTLEQLEQRLAKLEDGLTKPQTHMEIFAVKLCEHHGGNSSAAEANPCLQPEYFQRQAEALKDFYEGKITECLSQGKGNACFDPSTYDIASKVPAKPVSHGIDIGICKLIFNDNLCQ